MTLETIIWIGVGLAILGGIATVLVWFGDFTEQNDNPDDDKAGEKAKYIAALIRFFIGKIKAIISLSGKNSK